MNVSASVVPAAPSTPPPPLGLLSTMAQAAAHDRERTKAPYGAVVSPVGRAAVKARQPILKRAPEQPRLESEPLATLTVIFPGHTAFEIRLGRAALVVGAGLLAATMLLAAASASVLRSSSVPVGSRLLLGQSNPFAMVAVFPTLEHSFAPEAADPGPAPPSDDLGLGTVAAASQLLAGRPLPEWVEAAGPAADAPDRLLWPVEEGWFVRGYGSGDGGYHLATDVAGELGTDVRSSAAGIVGYSGRQIRGYGNIVLIIHPGGWVTLYAHNEENLVAAGERVSAGQVIARLGSTGISRGPHVHYELMFEGRNCDPLRLFDPGVRHRNGEHTPVERVQWKATEGRPSSIGCAPRRRHPNSRHFQHEDVASIDGDHVAVAAATDEVPIH